MKAFSGVSTFSQYAESTIPTEYGPLRVAVYRDSQTGDEHSAIIAGDISGREDVLARVHSECFTGEVLHSYKCDCREQLDLALRRIARAGAGVVVYLRQEGRGIGLGNKIRAYALQEQGYDTVDANTTLGFEPDARRYGAAVAMLKDLGVASVALMTNNPDKVQALREEGVLVTRRVPHRIASNPHSHGYLLTKRDRMGHMLEERADFEHHLPMAADAE